MSISLSEFWKMANAELRRANANKRHPFRNIILATTGDNYPNMRMVIMRKFDQDQNIIIDTDARSQKLRELNNHPNSAASLLFWHPKKSLQVRMKGSIEIIKANEEAKKYWGYVPTEAKKLYTTSSPPGTVIESPENVQFEEAFGDGRYFTLLHFQPKAMDILQLKLELHLRAEFERTKGNWKGQWLVP